MLPAKMWEIIVRDQRRRNREGHRGYCNIKRMPLQSFSRCFAPCYSTAITNCRYPKNFDIRFGVTSVSNPAPKAVRINLQMLPSSMSGVHKKIGKGVFSRLLCCVDSVLGQISLCCTLLTHSITSFVFSFAIIIALFLSSSLTQIISSCCIYAP